MIQINYPPGSRTKPFRVLVSGLGIAGATLAWWLAEFGMEVTVVERAPAPRRGGYMIDFWGLGYDVAERMGVLDPLRADAYRVDEIRLVRADSRTLAAIKADAVTATMGERFFSILRADLAGGLERLAAARADILFNDAVQALDPWDGGVDVRFLRAKDATFDVVVGAEGVHSPTRAEVTAFPCEFPLGFCTASFSVAGYPQRDPGAYVSFTEVGRQIARYALRDDRTAFFFIFRTPIDQAGIPHDLREQRAALRTQFGDAWECRDILSLLDKTEDLYFDEVTQVQSPRWSKGRIALVGDAAYCPSLLAGEGASLAMAGAYILAGELADTPADPPFAFARYEKRLRPLIERRQRGAMRLGGWFAPRTKVGLLARNGLSQLAAIPGVAPLVLGGMFSAGDDLPDYGRRQRAPSAAPEVTVRGEAIARRAF